MCDPGENKIYMKKKNRKSGNKCTRWKTFSMPSFWFNDCRFGFMLFFFSVSFLLICDIIFGELCPADKLVIFGDPGVLKFDVASASN